ncbi:MAG TPA: DUF72 domain-containing protein [Polyangiaceae bacterium]|nr:DUF72 domain-containing protein [Polyangiaceae bacterium]
MTEPGGDVAARAAELASRAREPAVTANVLHGTAGWTDRSLLEAGLFYPRGLKTGKERLAFYAKHFPVVEVDATYYTIPSPEVARGWVASTPSEFVFDVKAHPVFTGHPIDVTRLSRELRARIPESEGARIRPDRLPPEVGGLLVDAFRDFVAPLVEAGRLGAVFVQFPPWFSSTRGNARRLEKVRESLRGLPIAVEFRHGSWLEPARLPRVTALLRDLGASYVVVDEPAVRGGGVPPTVLVTNDDLAVVRFHGHNVAGWHRGASVAERFDYLYSPEELAAWVPAVKNLSGRARRVHAIFNNCVRNYAVLDAKGLSVLLAEATSTKEGG